MNTPDRWVVIEITNGEEKIQKVLCGWYGGYAGTDYWQINSGIVNVVETDNYYEFHGKSGSVYKCFKGSYGMSGMMHEVYHSLLKQQTDKLKIQIVEKYGEHDE